MRTPGPEAPELASSLVMQAGRWFIPDRVFEQITGEQPSAINQRADRNRIATEQANRAQLIDFACDLKAIPMRGHPSRLYLLDAALTLLAATESFPKLYTRESATEALHAAFEWAQERAETNPARLQRRRQPRARLSEA